MIEVSVQLARRDFGLEARFAGDGGVTALFGPSGCGKTTVIRLVAGLERPDVGRIVLGDRVLVDTEKRIFVAPHRRRIGLVFQDAQLFPHLSVAGNLGYGRFFTPEPARRVERDAVIAVLGIGHLLERRPATLSGGERQRVAIGRALLTSPDLLLMDEPLAALDEERKLEILPFVEGLRDEFGIPILYVSHAVEEVARLASTVVRMDRGRVTAIGAPEDVMAPAALAHPVGRFDTVSVLTGRIASTDRGYGVTHLVHPAGNMVLPTVIADHGAPIRVTVRATDVSLAREAPGGISTRSQLRGRVATVESGSAAFVHVRLELEGGEHLVAWVTRLGWDSLKLAPGDPAVALMKSVAFDERGVTDRVPRPAGDLR